MLTKFAQHCGTLLWEEISFQQQALVADILALPNIELQTSNCYKARNSGTGLISWVSSMISKLPVGSTPQGPPSSAASRRYTPQGNLASGSSQSGSQPHSQSQASATTPVPGNQQLPPTTAQCVRTQTHGSSNRNDKWILFGANGGRRTLKPCQISINDQSTDYSVFQELKKAYRSQRGLLRLWFSIWQLEYCQVVKVPYIATWILHS